MARKDRSYIEKIRKPKLFVRIYENAKDTIRKVAMGLLVRQRNLKCTQLAV